MMKEIKVIIRKVNRDYINSNYDLLFASLYTERKEAVRKLKRDEPKLVSITAGRLLQDVVSRELGITAEELTLSKGPNGKPYLESAPEFKFNISHSGEYVALAYGAVEVGVDIEQIKKENTRVAKRCFTEKENKYIAGDDKRFTLLWTMKESYLKLTGRGISVPLNSFEVDVENKVLQGETYNYNTFELDDYVLSVCAEGEYKVTVIREDEWVSCLVT